MNFFGPAYDKNVEVSCIPQNKNGEVKQIGESVKYIEKEYTQAVPMKVKNDTYQTLGGYPTKTINKYYVLKKHLDKIKNATIDSLEVVRMNSQVVKNGNTYKDDNFSVIYKLSTSEGKVISGVSSNTGCFHDKIFFITDGVSTGGLRRRNKRVTIRKRKMSRRSHHKKSRKSRK
jgi:hypothetical protein